jgi:hypothetical protein
VKDQVTQRVDAKRNALRVLAKLLHHGQGVFGQLGAFQQEAREDAVLHTNVLLYAVQQRLDTQRVPVKMQINRNKICG